MSVPSRFFLGLITGILIAFGIYLGLFYWQLGAPTQLSYWCHDINTRKLARAASIQEPKLLIVGGSGALFGINARLLESRLGVPAVNLSTHAALGTAYILDLARKAAKPGDTVLLANEFELYEHGNGSLERWADTLFLDYVMARDAPYFRSLPILDQILLAMRVPTDRLKEGLRNKRHPPLPPQYPGFSVYDPRLVDDYGDMTGHRRSRIPSDARQELETSRFLVQGLPRQPSGMDDIRSFCLWAREDHIRVLATFPNICDQPAYHSPQVAKTEAAIVGFFRELGVPFVGTLRDVLLPRSEFFDTCYHLTEEAAADRTRRLAAHLGPYFQKPPSAAAPAPAATP